VNRELDADVLVKLLSLLLHIWNVPGSIHSLNTAWHDNFKMSVGKEQAHGIYSHLSPLSQN
jgi:hypothetical protein